MKTWFECTRWALLFIGVAGGFSSAAGSSSSAQKEKEYQIVGASHTFCFNVPLSGTIQYNSSTIGLMFNKNTGINERFKNRLRWDNRTGFFTLSDLRTDDSGVYTVENTDSGMRKEYQLDVYENVLTLQMTIYTQYYSDKHCSLVCSVRNGRGLKLFWYNNSVTLNHTSCSSLDVPLYLPLEIEKPKNDNYICVASNPVSIKTTTVDVNTLCLYSHEGNEDYGGRQRFIVAAVLSGFLIVGVIVAVVCLRSRKCHKDREREDSSASEELHEEVQYTVITHNTDPQAYIHESFPVTHKLTTIYDQIRPHESEVPEQLQSTGTGP